MNRLLIVVLAAAAVCASCARRPVQNDIPAGRTLDHSKADHSEMESSPGAARAPYELQFIDTMIIHQQGAIDAAQMVATRAQHAELKQLAAYIIADQQRETAQMKRWRMSWFGDAAQAVNLELPGMKEGMHGMDLEKLDLLKQNGFDIEFINQMIPHHESAVTMAMDLLKHDAHPELKELAENIVSSQSAEAERMKSWQKEWKR